MRRTCERPGCGEPVAVVYGLEDGQQFWVDSWSPDRAADVPPAGARGVLCVAHGDVLAPPRGWTLVDRRDVVPRLFKPKLVVATGDDSASLKRPASATSRRRISDVPRPQLFSDIDRENDPIEDISADVSEPTGLLLRDAFRRAGTIKREAAHELLRSTSTAPVADSDQR